MKATTFYNTRNAVLVFDSGVGGLSVYKKIQQLLPGFHYIYAFDNVAFPYGEKSETFIIGRVVLIISAVLLHYTLALAVIACNTASVASLPTLRREFQFPVVGVVPAIKPASLLTTNGIIGLLATSGTLKHFYTHNLINRFANKRKIVLLDSSELVKLTEKKLRGEIVSLNTLRRILNPWLGTLEIPDTVVLGCTHFPLLREELSQVLPAGTLLVDSGTAVARRVALLLKHKTIDTKALNTNIVFCTALTRETKRLLPVLYSYNFSIIERLSL